MSDLSPRELQIARLVCDDLSDKQIAARLGISPHTVARHLERIAAKIDADPRQKRRAAIRRWCEDAA